MTFLLCRHTLNTLDKKTFELLKFGYLQLASFLDDEEAKAAVVAMAAISSGDPERIASPVVSEAMERFTRGSEETKRLAAEFNAAIVKLGIQL